MTKSNSFWLRLRYSWRTKRRPLSVLGLLRMWWHDFVLHPLGRGTEVCEDCGDWHFPCWSSPDELWALASPSGGQVGLLCPACFTRRLEHLGIVTLFKACVLVDKRGGNR